MSSIMYDKARDVVVSNSLAAWVNAALYYSGGKVSIYSAIRDFRKAFSIEEDEYSCDTLYRAYNRYQHSRKRSKYNISSLAEPHNGVVEVEIIEGSALLDAISKLLIKLENVKDSPH